MVADLAWPANATTVRQSRVVHGARQRGACQHALAKPQTELLFAGTCCPRRTTLCQPGGPTGSPGLHEDALALHAAAVFRYDGKMTQSQSQSQPQGLGAGLFDGYTALAGTYDEMFADGAIARAPFARVA